MYYKVKGMLDALLISYEKCNEYWLGEKLLNQGFLLTMKNGAKYYLEVDDSVVFVVCVKGEPSKRFFCIYEDCEEIFKFGFYLRGLFEQNRR